MFNPFRYYSDEEIFDTAKPIRSRQSHVYRIYAPIVVLLVLSVAGLGLQSAAKSDSRKFPGSKVAGAGVQTAPLDGDVTQLAPLDLSAVDTVSAVAVPVLPETQKSIAISPETAADTTMSSQEPVVVFVPQLVYRPMTPCRLMDTRNNIGEFAKPDQNNIVLIVAGKCGIPAKINAIAISIVSILPAEGSYLTIWDDNTPKPDTSTLNVAVGEVRSNAAIVGAQSGKLDIYNYAKSVDTIVDAAGYWETVTAPSSSGRFEPISTQRIYDSRNTSRKIADSELVFVPLPAGVPADAVAIVGNITAANNTTGGTFVSAWPAGTPRPNASIINFDAPNESRASGGIYPVANGGIYISPQNGATDIIMDVSGYMTGDSAAASLTDGYYVPARPTRIYDSRSNDTAGRKLGLGSSVAMKNYFGDRASGLVYNATIVSSESGGFVSVVDGDNESVASSSVNASHSGETVANMAIVGSNGIESTANMSVSAHLLVDVVGFFSTATKRSHDPAKYNEWRVYKAPTNASKCQSIIESQLAIVAPKIMKLKLGRVDIVSDTTSGQPPGTAYGAAYDGSVWVDCAFLHSHAVESSSSEFETYAIVHELMHVVQDAANKNIASLPATVYRYTPGSSQGVYVGVGLKLNREFQADCMSIAYMKHYGFALPIQGIYNPNYFTYNAYSYGCTEAGKYGTDELAQLVF
jgi:hypothetical protein